MMTTETVAGIPIVQSGSRWIARCSYEQKEIVKAAGFRWDRDDRCWYTTSASVAAKLSPEAHQKRVESIVASRAAEWHGEIPCPEGLKYMPFQLAGIAYAMSRPATLLGDQMGLGKTIQAIGMINADPSINRVLVICPASLRLNWQRELERWLVRPMTIEIAIGNHCPTNASAILIANYDICARHAAALRSAHWDLLILDEAHYLKSADAKRTVAVLGVPAKKGTETTPGINARRKLALTGTPIPNRPIEGWTVFHALDPVEFNSFWGYARRYAAAYQSKYGWDLSGASNLGELQDKLRASIMVRRLKEDVLTELPAKRRSVIEIPANGASGAVDREQAEYNRHEAHLDALRVVVELAKAGSDEEYTAAVAVLREGARVAFTAMSQVRHDTAVAKVPYVVEHVRNAIEQGEKIVCFAHHRDVVSALMAEFPDAAKLTGEDGMQDRQDAVDRFQSDPACKLFIGNIQAAGVGITLTAAAHVVFAELDWVPGNVSQAEDRCHRIGQRNAVLVEHLVLEGSIDARMVRTLIVKQDIIDRALDREEEIAPVTPYRERAATETANQKQIAEVASTLTPARITAIHTALRMLAGMCDGARELDGAGFSKIDVQIGHSLAERDSLTPKQAALGTKLANKYRRQLPETLIESIKG